MHKKHTPARRDGFAKYRARHSRHTLLLLPPAKRRALQRNLIFIGVILGLVLVAALISKAQAAGGAYVVDDGAINTPGNAMSTPGTAPSGTRAVPITAPCRPPARSAPCPPCNGAPRCHGPWMQAKARRRSARKPRCRCCHGKTWAWNWRLLSGRMSRWIAITGLTAQT